jgi:uncharacterized damage-inducible protein DinB
MLRTTMLVAIVGCGTLFSADLKTEFLNEVSNLEKKYVGLAEAIPAEKYGWRPAENARSVSEVLMHVAGANYMLPGMVGVKAPEGISRDMEKKVTAKDQVLAEVKKSFGHLRETASVSADPEKTVKVFGMEMSQRGFLTFLGGHLHEHLGQLIAYARSNGVKPPWARGE